MNTYTITDVQIKRGSGYGHYIISGNVDGNFIEATTTDSEAFDWLNDDSDLEMQAQAIKHCEMKLEMAFEKSFNY